MLLLPTPTNDFVEQDSFVVPTSPVASGLLQPTPVFEQFAKQILAFVAVLVITAAVFARSSPSHSLPARTCLFLFLVLTVV
jgi:hypothetical protein